MKLYTNNIVASNVIKLNEITFIEIEYIIDRKRNKLLIVILKIKHAYKIKKKIFQWNYDVRPITFHF